MSRSPSYLAKNRHGIYFFRARIPERLRHHFDNKTEIKRSLRTDSRREAMKLARAYRVELDRIMDKLDKKQNDSSKFELIVFVDPDGMRFEIDHGDPEEERKSAVAIAQATRSAGNPPPKQVPNPSTPLLSKAKDEFVQYKLNNGWKEGESSHLESLPKLDLLLEIIGDKPCSELTEQDAVRVWDSLPLVPADRKTVGTSLAEQLASDKTLFRRISKKHQRTHFDLFRAFVKFCKTKRYIADDIVGELRINVTKEEAKQGSYKKFDDGDLQRIFSGHVYRETKPHRSPGHDYQFWLPLLATFTGARINELCQLLISDIKKSKDGIWFIDITDDDEAGKSVKTEAGRRYVPVHSTLIDLGFIEFVQAPRSGPNRDMLFTTGLRYYKAKGKWGKDASEWFNGYGGKSPRPGYKQQCGIEPESKKVFHSFRKSFASKLAQHIEIARLAALIGHEQEFKTTFIYAGNFELSTLKDDIEKLSYDIDLSHVSFEKFRRKYSR